MIFLKQQAIRFHLVSICDTIRVLFLGLGPGGGIDWTQLGRSKWPLVAALGAGCLVGASGLFLVQVQTQFFTQLLKNQWLNSVLSVYRGVWSWRRLRGPCPKSSHNSTPPYALCREGLKNLKHFLCWIWKLLHWWKCIWKTSRSPSERSRRLS